MSKEQLKKEWEDKIARYEASGKKKVEWCRENGINLRVFYRWFKKIREQETSIPKAQSWIPVQITGESQASSLNLKIGKVYLEVKEDFNPSLLAAVVKVLGEIC